MTYIIEVPAWIIPIICFFTGCCFGYFFARVPTEPAALPPQPPRNPPRKR